MLVISINTNTLSFMHHHVKSQNASMGHTFQRFPFSGFMPICNECFGVKHTFVQKGDYLDVRSGSSFVVAITWHLFMVSICCKFKKAACSNVTVVLWMLPGSPS